MSLELYSRSHDEQLIQILLQSFHVFVTAETSCLAKTILKAGEQCIKPI